jgi:hypothetical protein
VSPNAAANAPARIFFQYGNDFDNRHRPQGSSAALRTSRATTAWLGIWRGVCPITVSRKIKTAARSIFRSIFRFWRIASPDRDRRHSHIPDVGEPATRDRESLCEKSRRRLATRRQPGDAKPYLALPVAVALSGSHNAPSISGSDASCTFVE